MISLEGWSSTIELHPHSGAGERNRTHNLLITSQLLYQLSYTSLISGASERNRTTDTGIFSPLLYQLSYYRMATVRTKRLELLRLSTPDPKSGASAIPPRPQKTSGATTEESDPLEIRTPDTLIKSQVLCQLS